MSQPPKNHLTVCIFSVQFVSNCSRVKFCTYSNQVTIVNPLELTLWKWNSKLNWAASFHTSANLLNEIFITIIIDLSQLLFVWRCHPAFSLKMVNILQCRHWSTCVSKGFLRVLDCCCENNQKYSKDFILVPCNETFS